MTITSTETANRSTGPSNRTLILLARLRIAETVLRAFLAITPAPVRAMAASPLGINFLENDMRTKLASFLSLALAALALFAIVIDTADARGRRGSHRVGGYTSHGKEGSHYVGGH